MKYTFEILKRNWLVMVLAAVILVLLARQLTPIPLMTLGQRSGGSDSGFGGVAESKIVSIGMMPPVFQEPAPVSDVNRLVVTNTNISLKVNDVRKAIEGINSIATRLGGFMVDSSLNQPEEGASGNISIRIPASKLNEGLNEIRDLGVKVISENVVGTDVTAEFVDIEARLETLLKTKAKFEQIMAGASSINDLLNIQRELINLQSQIDSLRGQQKYLEQTARLSLVTVYLATDELALPYAPAASWRPSVIFKEAVRALISSLRGVGSAAIWITVYSVVWLPILLVFWWLKRRLGRG